MEELLQRVVDSALSISILVTWVLLERREKHGIWEQFKGCMQRFETHLEEHDAK